MDNKFPQPICEAIWGSKYQFKTDRPGFHSDKNITDTWERMARSVTKNDEGHERFYEILEDFKFSPAGRIIAGAGTGRNVTLFNCFVMGTVPDSLEGIFNMLKEAALTMQQGGGIGYDFSTIRPSTAFVKGVEAEASGPLSFMDVWDSMCHTIMSAGGRRGAMMATMMCNHPDIMDFITAKREVGRLNRFNMSVLVTDELMNKVNTGEDIALVHPEPPMSNYGIENPEKDADGNFIYGHINAKVLWDAIMAETYHHAEPGVIFIDRINKLNNLWFAEEIRATNPCGEQPLPPYGACLLGSVNLTKFVLNPFTEEASFDFKELARVTGIAVDMLDRVIDVSNFPLIEQEKEAKDKRRMGIGITGLADAMFMMGLKYGDDFSRNLTSDVMECMTMAAYEASIRLAQSRGPAPIFSTAEARQKALEPDRGTWGRLPQHLKSLFLEFGARNSHLISIAPTGTMSIYMGNISSGVEPNFADSYVRKVLNKDGTKSEERVYAASMKVFVDMWDAADDLRRRELDSWMENFWCTAQTLDPEDHIAIQAAAQEWVDSSISKTVNLPEDISEEDFSEVYVTAYEAGCKGCTTYRPNDILGSVLSVEEPKKEAPELEEEATPSTVDVPLLMERPKEVDGKTYKIRWQGDAYYVTFNHVPGSQGWWVPFEMFVMSKNVDHQAWITALTRMVSAVFRRGGDIRFIGEELKAVFDPKGGQFVEGKYCPSLVALLGKTLEDYLMTIGYQSTPEDGSEPTVQPAMRLSEPEMTDEEGDGLISVTEAPNQCPSCKEFSVVVVSGCPTCQSCGHSKCG